MKQNTFMTRHHYARIILALVLMAAFIGVVSATDPPNASFSCTPLSGLSPLSVTCTDASTNSPTGWAWWFGDELWNQPWIQKNESSGWVKRSDFGYVSTNSGAIVLFGGGTPTRKNDVWASYDNGSTWALINGSAAWTAREDFAFTHLPDDSIVLMGGTTGTRQNDTWRSTDGGNIWILMNPSSGWSKRTLSTSVALSDGSIVLMGGLDGTTYKNDTWRSTDNGATWVLMNGSSGWPGRYALSSAVMADGSILVIAGVTLTSVKDIWKSTDKGATWSLVNSAPSWTLRRAPNVVVMPDNSIVLMGGSASGATGIKDVWRSTDAGVTWAKINATPGWAGRFLGGSVVLPNGTIVIFGGFTTTYTNDTWTFSPQSSSVAIPSHIYSALGYMSVTLQSFNSAGYNSTTKLSYIYVNPIYYAYGDSITRATGYDLLNSTGFDCYLLNMTRRYDITNASSTGHNMDGGSMTSNWGVSNIASHPGSVTRPTRFFIMFGGNDVSILPNQTADNLASMYSVAKTNGSSPYILLENPWPNSTPLDFTAQSNNMSQIKTRLSTYWNIPYIQTYDALDYVPENGIFDSLNLTTQDVSGHPNVLGHSLMADYIWAAINGTNVSIPTAVFTANATSGQTPLSIQFTDASLNTSPSISPTFYNWSFGDGYVSNLQSPTHQYTTPGNYSVSEMVTGSFGSNTMTKSNYIDAYSILPSFTASPLSGSNPLTVKFNDTSYSYWPISSWLWDFGDNRTSTARNVSHTYTTDGYYSVNLTITDSLGNKNYTFTSNYINVNESFPAPILPVAIFEANITAGNPPLTVQFYDESINATSQNWSFGDGQYSISLNPLHTYSSSGQYDVSLSVNNSYASAYLLKQKFINVVYNGTPHLYYWVRTS